MLLTQIHSYEFIILYIEGWGYLKEIFFMTSQREFIYMMIFLYEHKFKYATYKYVCTVSKFYWQKCLLSVFTNDNTSTNKVDHVKKMAIEYFHSSLINF